MSDLDWEIGWSIVVLATALIIGAAGGAIWPALAAGFALIALRHGYHLVRLAGAMARGRPVDGALPRGLWRGVYRDAGRLRTRSRKRKRRLARFLTRFRDAAAALPDAAVVIGREGRIEWSNPAASLLLGLRMPDDLGTQLVDRVREPSLREFLGETTHAHAIQFLSPADGSKIVSVRATPFGKKHQRLIVARDVTQIYHADRAAQDFAANVSHELRTPLTVINGYLETLCSDARDAGDARALTVMHEQAGRMGRIIDDLLLMSRLQADGASVELAPVAVAELLGQIASEARAVSAAGAHVVELDADPRVAILGSAEHLRGAFANLIVNAVRHTPPRTEVRIRWWGDEDGAHLCVSDTGEGIPARHIPRLTERFYRVDDSRSRETGGTGLGLAIVKLALDRHGAELQIESAAGRGTTFSCHFPAQLVVADEGGAPGSEDDGAGG